MATINKNAEVERWRNPMTTEQLNNFYIKLYSRKNNCIEIEPRIKEISDFEILPVENKEAKGILKKYHYLPSHGIIGRLIRHQVIETETNELLAILFWGNTPAPSLEARDQFLRLTDKEERLSKICRIGANNTRFLILPYVKVPNLATQILSKSIKKLKIEWMEKYGDKLEFLETFVDPSYGFNGTCYLAASWKMVGYTKGYSFHGTRYFGLKGFQTMPKCNTKKMIYVRIL